MEILWKPFRGGAGAHGAWPASDRAAALVRGSSRGPRDPEGAQGTRGEQGAYSMISGKFHLNSFTRKVESHQGFRVKALEPMHQEDGKHPGRVLGGY